MFARHFIDSLDFAHNGGELHGVAPLSEMPRLLDLLAIPETAHESGSSGEISFFVSGLPNVNGKPMLEVTVNGACQLRCQRCLGSFTHPINLVSRLLLARAGEIDEFSVEEDDEVDSIVAEKRLDVLNMIEEEILLSLPFAPKHPLGDCKPAVELTQASKHPFAALEGLKNLSGFKIK